MVDFTVFKIMVWGGHVPAVPLPHPVVCPEGSGLSVGAVWTAVTTPRLWPLLVRCDKISKISV